MAEAAKSSWGSSRVGAAGGDTQSWDAEERRPRSTCGGGGMRRCGAGGGGLTDAPRARRRRDAEVRRRRDAEMRRRRGNDAKLPHFRLWCLETTTLELFDT
jgi:hypothetical protein